MHVVEGFRNGAGPRLAEALRYWEAKRGARPMPARRDIRLHEIPAVLPTMMLLDVAREPLDFVFRFIGVGLRLRFGGDLTGRSITEIESMRPGTRVWENYATAVLQRRAHFVEVPFVGADNKVRIAQDMLMPLADDGETVDGLFAALDFAPAG